MVPPSEIISYQWATDSRFKIFLAQSWPSSINELMVRSKETAKCNSAFTSVRLFCFLYLFLLTLTLTQIYILPPGSVPNCHHISLNVITRAWKEKKHRYHAAAILLCLWTRYIAVQCLRLSRHVLLFFLNKTGNVRIR